VQVEIIHKVELPKIVEKVEEKPKPKELTN
jgi:hypothetical protein